MAERFERFTDRARKVMQLAEREAHRGNWECVDTSHLLLALAAEGDGVGAAALREHGLDLPRLRALLSELGLPQPPAEPELVTLGKLPLTPKVLAVIEASHRDRAALGDTYVGTEHLLLGTLAVEDATGCALLRSADVSPDAVAATVFELLGRVPGEPPAARPVRRLSRPAVATLIDAERAYQDAKWGDIDRHPHEVGAWVLLARTLIDRAATKWAGAPGDHEALVELVKAVSVGVACLEQHGGALVAQAHADLARVDGSAGATLPNGRLAAWEPFVRKIGTERRGPPDEARVRELLGNTDLLDGTDYAHLAAQGGMDAHEGAEWLPYYKIALGVLMHAFGVACGAAYSRLPVAGALVGADAEFARVMAGAVELARLSNRVGGIGPRTDAGTVQRTDEANAAMVNEFGERLKTPSEG